MVFGPEKIEGSRKPDPIQMPSQETKPVTKPEKVFKVEGKDDQSLTEGDQELETPDSQVEQEESGQEEGKEEKGKQETPPVSLEDLGRKTSDPKHISPEHVKGKYEDQKPSP